MLNTFCPGRGSNQDLLRGSQTLYRIAIKAGLYRKAVQVCIIPNITTYTYWDFMLKQGHFSEEIDIRYFPTFAINLETVAQLATE